MDLKIKYEYLLNLYQNLGEEQFFELFNEFFSNFKLLSMSLDWIQSRRYILKFKGECGDIIIDWI